MSATNCITLAGSLPVQRCVHMRHIRISSDATWLCRASALRESTSWISSPIPRNPSIVKIIEPEVSSNARYFRALIPSIVATPSTFRKVGKFPFLASGKALAVGRRGFGQSHADRLKTEGSAPRSYLTRSSMRPILNIDSVMTPIWRILPLSSSCPHCGEGIVPGNAL